jgi:hypothetical protein
LQQENEKFNTNILKKQHIFKAIDHSLTRTLRNKVDKQKLIMVCGHYNFNNLPNSITGDIKITTEVKSMIMNKLNELLSYV